jgi:hypothetical protein
VKLSSWPEIGSDCDVLLTPYVPKGITGYDDYSGKQQLFVKFSLSFLQWLQWTVVAVTRIWGLSVIQEQQWEGPTGIVC